MSTDQPRIQRIIIIADNVHLVQGDEPNTVETLVFGAPDVPNWIWTLDELLAVPREQLQAFDYFQNNLRNLYIQGAPVALSTIGSWLNLAREFFRIVQPDAPQEDPLKLIAAWWQFLVIPRSSFDSPTW